MIKPLEIAGSEMNSGCRFEPPITAMHAFVRPYAEWFEEMVDCRLESAVILEVEFPLGDLAATELLPDLVIPAKRRLAADSVRRFLTDRRGCELPPQGGLRLQLEVASTNTCNEVTWNAAWKETPVAFRFRPLRHGSIWANIPYVSGMSTRWRSWLIVHPSDVSAALALLGNVMSAKPKTMSVEGGTDVELSAHDYDWNRIVLEPALVLSVKTDFETFWSRRDWFVANHLPYKRGYLLHGPPGNGKTSVVRTMVCHPKVAAFSIDFGSAEISNRSLTSVFEEAALNSPSVIVFEDLDRRFNEHKKDDGRVDFTHFLNCLDGVQSQEGVVVVATANNPRKLDPALLRRPGRFDRIAHFPNPALAGRRQYFGRMAGAFDAGALDRMAQLADGLTFAQLRECHILAGQFAFLRGDELSGADLQEAILQVRSQFTGKVAGPLTPEVGFSHRA